MPGKILDYQDRDSDRAERRDRSPNYRRIIKYIAGLLVFLVVAGLVARVVYLQVNYPTRFNVITCVDSETGMLLSASPAITDCEDDPSIEINASGGQDQLVHCERNSSWVELEISKEGYKPLQIKIDDTTPSALTVRLQRLQD